MAHFYTGPINETKCIGDSLDQLIIPVGASVKTEGGINTNFLSLDNAVQGLSSAINTINTFNVIDTTTVDLTYTLPARSLTASVKDNSIDYTKVASGMVLNCVNVFVNTPATYSITANTDTEITALSTTITPKTTTSKILIQAMINSEVQNDSVFRLARVVGASAPVPLGTAAAASNRLTGIAPMSYDLDNNTTMSNTYIQFYDTPGTIQPVTYRFYVRRADNATFFLNRTLRDTDTSSDERASSSVTLLEIK
jgi:hypothetical protein